MPQSCLHGADTLVASRDDLRVAPRPDGKVPQTPGWKACPFACYPTEASTHILEELEHGLFARLEDRIPIFSSG
jgi:hypothetical protein